MSDKNTEGLYSMRVLTRLTGLSADVIRKWEERYAAVRPRRTAGNTRRFTPRQTERKAGSAEQEMAINSLVRRLAERYPGKP